MGTHVRKIELGAWTYGYFRVMELMAWTYCARAIAFFNDLPALLMVVGFAILMQGLRMISEYRDIRAAIEYDEAVANQAKKIKQERT